MKLFVEKHGGYLAKRESCGVIRHLLALFFPIAAGVAQWLLWGVTEPYAFLFFYPAVFLSARIGRAPSDLIAIVLSTLIALWLFIPPVYTFVKEDPNDYLAAAMFFFVGFMFCAFQRRSRATARIAELAIAELSKSEMKWRQLIEQAPDGIFLTGSDGSYAEVNTAACAMLGYSQEEILKLGTAQLAHPDDLCRLAALRNQMKSGGVIKDELRLRHKNGSYVPIEVSVRILPDGQRQAFVRDVSERKRAEEELRGHEAKFRALVEHSPDLIARFDVECRCVYVNPAFLGLTGLTQDEVKNKPIEGMTLPADFGLQLADALRKVVQTQTPQLFECSYSYPHGIRYFQTMAVPEFAEDGNVSYVLTMGRDISIIKAGESVLRESERRIHGITSNIPGMVFQCQFRGKDGGFRFSYVSEGSQRLLGIAPGELLANPQAFFERIAAFDRQRLEASLYVTEEFSTLNWEGHATSRDGMEKWMNCRAIPRPLADGSVVWEGVMLNITGSKRNEEELRKSQEMLRELSAHMEYVREEERKKIAREIHDELGQALTALRMDVSLLRLNFGGENAQLTERAQAMTAAVDRTIQIVRHVTTTLRPVALDLGPIAAIEWLVEEFVKRSGLKCHMINKGVREFTLDDVRATTLFRIVQESLTNIVKHADATEVEIVLAIDGASNLCVRIKDNGKGFSIDSARKAGSYGLLGMRERVLTVQGALKIQSEPRGGCCIDLSIPLDAHIDLQRYRNDLHGTPADV